MSESSSMLLIGVGGSGCAMARGIHRAFGENLRYMTIDTDAAAGADESSFVLLGGNRLSGRGSGGDIVAARLAAEESITAIDHEIEGVRLAIIVTSLGGGTGGGVTLHTVRHLAEKGIPSIVFATTPFTFEGEDRQRNARGVTALISEDANASFFIPLDDLVDGVDNMEDALKRAVDTLASAISLFWRMVEKPGYLQLDVEKIRRIVASAGRGRIAVATAQGDERAEEVLDKLIHSRLLTCGSGPVRTILCGVLAGQDLRLTEIGTIANGLRSAFGKQCHFELATVNDETTFGGRLSVVAMLFEEGLPSDEPKVGPKGARKRHAKGTILGQSATPTKFNNVEPTTWNGEDLDAPTYLRRNINLDF